MSVKISGIYLIRDVVGFGAYIGSSIDIRKRWNVHRQMARKGKHHSPSFQKSWDEHGERNFKYHILEELPPEKERLEYNEQNYIWVFEPSFNSYSIVRPHGLTKEGQLSLSAHMKRMGSAHKGIKRNRASINRASLSRVGLTIEEVEKIIREYKNGDKISAIAKRRNLDDTKIWRIVNNKILVLQQEVSEILQKYKE